MGSKVGLTWEGKDRLARPWYGIEIPCVYCFFGPKIYVDKMKEVVDSLTSSGLL